MAKPTEVGDSAKMNRRNIKKADLETRCFLMGKATGPKLGSRVTEEEVRVLQIRVAPGKLGGLRGDR